MRCPYVVRQTAPLSEKELNSYRQWAAELQKESGEPGGSCNCDPEVWEYFNPTTAWGKQIYESFTDEELLDLLLPTMKSQGHTPQFQKIHEIYRCYLGRRFGNLARVKEMARIRYKRRRDERRWPWDWPERVSVEPALDFCRKRGIRLSPEEQTLLAQLCQAAKYTRMPPVVFSQEQLRCLQRLGGVRQLLERMGIPHLERGARKHMRLYWKKQAALANRLTDDEMRKTGGKTNETNG